MGFYIRLRLKQKWAGNAARDAVRFREQARPTGAAVEEGIAYLQDGNPMHTLNLYRPEHAQGALPTVIDIHGGGWMYGDRTLNRNYCAYLASRGCGVVGMSYRLLPETDLAGQVQDVFASLHWLETHGAARCLDLDRVLLTGDSAGGHLAGLVACIQQSRDLQQRYGVTPVRFAFRALALSHGVYDVYHFNILEGWIGQRVQREYLRMMMGRHYRRSPLYGHASFRETAQGIELPPMLVIASQGDGYYGHTAELEAYLTQRGIAYERLVWDGAPGDRLGHVFQVSWWDWPESRQTNDRMLAFFQRVCPGPALEES